MISGATNQSYAASQSGSYSVTVTDANGCTGSDNIEIQLTQFSAADTLLCEKFCIDFTDHSLNNPVSWQWIFDGGIPATSANQDPTGICYDNPGLFDVTLTTTDASGNSDTLTLTDFITIYTNPFAPVITQNGNTLSSSPATSYQWYLNGVLIPGATNQSYEITQSGIYTVVIADANGCTSQSDLEATLVGIDELIGGSVSIYPNPTTGNFVIELSGMQAGTISILITNTLGQIIYQSEEEIISDQWKNEISLYPVPGIYIVEIKTEKESLGAKLVIAE